MSYARNRFQVLLTPSLSSLVICILVSITVMIAAGISYQAGRGAFYNYLFGKGSSVEEIASSKSTLSALNNTVLGNTILNKILYFAFWMAIGLIVYIILYVILRGTGAAAENLKEASYTNIKKENLLEDFAIKSVVRVAAILGWIVFSIIFFKVMLPFSILTAQTVSNDITSANAIIYSLLGLIVLFLSLHIEVVLIRFIFLRVRLFSQEEV